MPLQRIKVLFCVAAISIAIILDCTGGVIGWATAVIVLAGALPLFEAGSQAIGNATARAIIADAEAHSQNHPDVDALPR